MKKQDDKRTWDGLAKRYDRIVRVFGRSYPAIRERLAEDLKGRKRVLESAAGTGQFTSDIAAVVEELLATDLAPQMVERLQKKLEEAGVTNVRASVMSAYDLELEDGDFDAVFCANALHVMDQPQKALAEFKRVLRPDGILIIPTFLHAADRRRRLLSKTMSLFSSFVAYTRFDLSTLENMVSDAGFDVTRIEQLPGLLPIGYVKARVVTVEES